MNRGQLLELHAKLTDDARKLIVAKNADYSGIDGDPFRNFRRWGLLGIIVRLTDKVARLETFVDRGDLQVKSEKVRDTVIDIINYAILFEGYNADANREGSSNGNREVPPFTRPLNPELITGSFNPVPGDAGGGPGGARRGEFTETRYPKNSIAFEPADRVGASGGRGRAVGGKHRSTARKGKQS